MARLWQLVTAGGLSLSVFVLSSCYTYGTEPEFVRGPLSDQPDSIRRATVIRAEDFMEQREQLLGSTLFGQRNYRIAVGVRLNVEVVNQGISRAVYVGPDGKIDLPLVGTVQAAGRYLDDLREDLKGKYKPYFKGEFQINLNTERPDYSPWGGRWNLGGRATIVIADYSLRGSVVELEGDEGLSEVLFSRFGGVNDLGAKPEWKEIGIIREVYLEEEKKAETVIILCDLERLLFGGDLRHNVPIRHRDLVFVPRRRDTLLEEIHDSLGYWSSMLSEAQTIRDIVKAMESW